jgi:hypothetical protein
MSSLFLHVIHVSGSRMCAQGTDGLSWGQLDEGIMHHGTLHQVPLHLSALMQEPPLQSWVLSWFSDCPCFLTPME